MKEKIINDFDMLSEYVELHSSSCDWKSVQENLVNLIKDAESLISTLGKEDNLYDKLQEVYLELIAINDMLTAKKYNIHERLSDIKHFIATYFYE